MTYKCKLDRLTSSLSAVILVAAFAACMKIGSEFSSVLRTAIFAAGTAAFAAALYITARHLIYRYIYVLEADCIKIYRIVGKSSTMCANIPLYETLSLEKTKERSVPSYSYVQNIFPENTRYLLCESAGNKYTVKLEASEAFYTMLYAFMPSEKV